MTCDQCEFWRRDPSRYDGAGDCESPKLAYSSMCEPDGLAYLDCECYHASLVTGPKFGCVHFVSKDGEDR